MSLRPMLIPFSFVLAFCLHAHMPSQAQSSKTWAVITGISKYQNKDVPPLDYAHRDAKAFYDFLRSPAGGEVPAEQLVLLTEEAATNAAITTALYELMDKAKEGDQVYIFFAGHGDVETKAMLGFLLPWNAPPRVYAAGAIHLTFLQQVITTLSQQNKARVTMIADACHSGHLAGSATGGPQVTAQNLNQQYANEIKILACGPEEFSEEGMQWGGGRGVFSYHLIDGLTGMADRDGNYQINLNELERYLEDWVQKETDYRQLPRVIGDPRSPVSLVDPQQLADLKASKEKTAPAFDAIATRGMANMPPDQTDSLGIQLYEAFQKALAEKRLLNPEEQCAYFYYQQLITMPEFAPVGNTLRHNLAVALQDDAQDAINAYLLSDSREMERRWKQGAAGYAHIPSYLEKAVDLLGEEHYITPFLKAKQHYFEALLLRMESEENNREELLGQALEKINQALLLEPNGAHLYNEKGLIFGALEETEQEVQSYNQAHDLAPTWVMPLYNLGIVYTDLGELDRAEGYLQQVVSLDTTYAPGYNQLGQVFFKKGNYPEAEKAYMKSVELDPGLGWTYTPLTNLYYVTNEYAKAGYYGQKAIDFEPDDPNSYYGLANIKLKTEDYPGARELYEQAIRLDPQHPFAHFGLGIVLEKQGDPAGALGAYMKNFEVNPAYPAPCISVAALYAAQDEPEKALTWLQKGLENGYTNKSNLEENEDFDGIRELPAFKGLLKKYFSE